MSSQKGQSNRNWSEYNANLVNRGRLTLFIDQNFADSWYVKYDKTSQRSRGGQAKHTDCAIVSLLSLRYVFKLPLRAMEEVARSLITMFGLDSDVPDYTTLSIKLRDIKIKLPPVCKDSGSGHIASLDSTGVKIHGQGEWNRKKHSQKDRRQWVKVHFIIDTKTMQILGVEATSDDVHDSEVFDQLITALPKNITKVIGDGAYDTLDSYKKSLEHGIDLVALPRSNAVVDPTSKLPHILQRNRSVEYYKQRGIYAWAQKYQYWDCNKSETTVSRFKTAFSGTLASRKPISQKNEIILKCKILNIFSSYNNQPLDHAS